jgi:hypothetical protein
VALQKIDILSLGRGSLTSNANAVVAFSSNSKVDYWKAGTTYNQFNIVEYNSKIYRSKTALNTGNAPDSNPNDWETMYTGVKDGDIAFVFAGNSSSIMQRINDSWVELTPRPIEISLTDGAVNQEAVVFLASEYDWAKIDYVLHRNSGTERKRRGSMNILSDSLVSNVEYDHEFNEIGDDVNVDLYLTLEGGNVKLKYTSGGVLGTPEGVPISLKYTLSGWFHD